jgi:hypothetical protein
MTLVLRLLGAGVLALMLLWPAGVAAGRADVLSPICWKTARAYPFPYTGPGYRKRQFAHATPDCREGRRGTLDFTPVQGFTAYSSIAAPRLRLRPPHAEGPAAPRTWPLRDSLGKVFALLSQQRLPHALGLDFGNAPLDGLLEPLGLTDIWTVSYPDGNVYGTATDPWMRLLIQGRACMTNPRLQRENAMVVLFGGQHGHGPFAFGTQPYPGPVYMGVRGFLPVRALPPRGLADPRGRLRGRSTQEILDDFRTGCSQGDITSVPAPTTPEPKVHASLVPVFDWNDRYSGSGGVKDAGSRLANYHGWPDPKQDLPGPPGPVSPQATGRADIVREVKVMQSTTGIEGGGIVRAIVPASSRFVELDHFAYRDPNVLCTPAGQGRVEAAEAVQWMYVRIVGTGIDGWVPFRPKPNITRCTAGDVGKPPPGT